MKVKEKPFSIPNHWQWVELQDLAEINPTFNRTDLDDDDPVSFVGMKRMEEMSGRIDLSETEPLSEVRKGYTYFEDGDVLFAKITPCMENGKVAVARGLENGVGFGSTEFHVIRHPEEVTQEWIFHYLIQEGFRRDAKRAMTGSAGQKRVPTGYIEEVPIPLPPLSEQRRIVAKIEELFSNLDAGMDDLQAAGQQLERYRLSVLQAAVEGRLTADWRRTHDPEPADQLLERTLEKRRDRWEEDYRTKRYDSKGKTPPDGWKDRYSEPDSVDSSELPSLPSSWKWVRFEQISLLDSGYAFSSDKFTDEGMPLLRGANVAPGHLKWGDTEYWPEDEVGPYEHLIVEEGDIILAMDRPLINAGLKIARAEESDTPCLLVQRVARFKPVFESLSPFLYLTCRTQRFIAHLREGQTGTQIPHVSKKSLRAYPVPLPPLAEQKQIVDEVERLLSVADDAAATAEREQTRAERLRQSILKQAFSGRLVPHVEDAAPPQVDGSVSEGPDSDSSEGADEDVEDLLGSADSSKQIEMDL
ncbi:restriction endonuclease subunit S [Salinibacter sp.]|uniref:restriction endonuclease subunit S n=1 Tax=Salinibacter sp. TaxID=2065818 RepID=UPI0021E7EE93|nr:restriction endonuclease subunit S [Salinibacter sp.]